MRKFFHWLRVRVTNFFCMKCLPGCPADCSIKDECPGYQNQDDFYD